jgi:DNA repair exonuclease SbcCD ATPase subunit
MNKARRKLIEAVEGKLAELIEALSAIKGEEEEYRDNMPENLQASEKYEQADQACSALDDAYNNLESAADYLSVARE